MTLHKCDECGSEQSNELPIKINGYWPRNQSGIMLPEFMMNREFCGRECFLKFMRNALRYEGTE